MTLDDLPDAVAEAARRGMSRAALRIVAAAKLTCPVDTGRLRNSITSRVRIEDGEIVATAGTNVDYGPDVELGTSKRAATPYLRPALEANKAAARNDVRRAILEEIGGGQDV